MRSRKEIQIERERFLRQRDDILKRLSRSAQKRLFSALLLLLSGLKVDAADRLIYSSANAVKARQVEVVFRQFNQSNGIIRWLISGLNKILGLNRVYFKSVSRINESVENKARGLLFQRIGYDLKKERIIKNSWLDNLSSHNQVKLRVIKDINDAMVGQISKEEFLMQFKDRFTGKNGLGYIESYYNQFVGDLFMASDRAVQGQMAKDLGFVFFVYGGTVIKTTRTFCEDRNNKVFHRSEAKEWEALEWKGKKDPHNIFIDLGGHNCRHTLNWLPTPTAKKLLLQQRGKEATQQLFTKLEIKI